MDSPFHLRVIIKLSADLFMVIFFNTHSQELKKAKQLKKRNRIIVLVKKQGERYWKCTHKYGIKIPKNWEDCKRLDDENKNTMWQDAVAKEMGVVKVVFDILEDGATVPKGYQKIKCKLIFDVKMEDFRRKARLVAGGHMTKNLSAQHIQVSCRERLCGLL